MDFLFREIAPFTTQLIGAGALLVASFTSLFSVVNPLSAMPIFLSLTEDDTEEEKIKTARKSSTYMFFILLVFLFAGAYILSFFGISLSGIRIAGGMVIARAGFSMLSPDKSGAKISEEEREDARDKEDVSFSPIAMPLLSGPGSIAVVIGFGSLATNVLDYVVNVLAVLLAAISVFGILRIAPWLYRLIGKTGMTVVSRMMGFITLAIGVQFIINGIYKFFEIGS